MIYFDLLYKGLSRFYNPGYRFDMLTEIDPICRYLNI